MNTLVLQTSTPNSPWRDKQTLRVKRETHKCWYAMLEGQELMFLKVDGTCLNGDRWMRAVPAEGKRTDLLAADEHRNVRRICDQETRYVDTTPRTTMQPRAAQPVDQRHELIMAVRAALDVQGMSADEIWTVIRKSQSPASAIAKMRRRLAN